MPPPTDIGRTATLPPSQGARSGEAREFLPQDVEIRGLPECMQPVRAFALDPLVHLKCMEEPPAGGFSQGRTMRGSPSTAALRFTGQKVVKKDGVTSVMTALKHPSGLRCQHALSWQGNVPVFSSLVSVLNAGKRPITLEMLSSFSLGGITPYATDDAPTHFQSHPSVWMYQIEIHFLNWNSGF